MNTQPKTERCVRGVLHVIPAAFLATGSRPEVESFEIKGAPFPFDRVLDVRSSIEVHAREEDWEDHITMRLVEAHGSGV